MTDEVRHYVVTIPAGTAKTSPAVTDISFPPRTVEQVTWRVPVGPSGQMGWYLSMGAVPVRPLPPGTWVIADGQSGTWDGAGLPDSGAWQITGYNTGTYGHAVYIDFHVAVIRRPPALRVLLDPRTLQPAADTPWVPVPLPERR